MPIGPLPSRSPAPIRLALLDDHPIILHAMALALGNEPEMTVVGTYPNSQAMFAGLATHPADVLVVDFSLSKEDVDGLRLIGTLRRDHPDASILVYSSHSSLGLISAALRAGAQGYIIKTSDLRSIKQAVRTIASGRTYIDPDIALQLQDVPTDAPLSEQTAPPPDADHAGRVDTVEGNAVTLTPHAGQSLVQGAKLSLREREVIRCFLEGMTVSQIAAKFNRSVKTISSQKFSAYRKLGVSSDNELFKIAQVLDEF